MKNLNAINTYSQIANNAIQSHDIAKSKINSTSTNFSDVMKVNFNKFANMTQTQIIKEISGSTAATGSSTSASSGVASAFVSDLRKKQENYERNALGRISSESSSVDTAMAAVEASNATKIAVELRNKMHDIVDKMLNMNI